MVRLANRYVHYRGTQFFVELTDALATAIRTYVEYDVPDENEQTKRERSEWAVSIGADGAFDPPAVEIPDNCEYFWEWFFDLSAGVSRVSDGVCNPINWSEMIQWATATGTQVEPWEYDVLRAIDTAFCAETNIAFAAYRERAEDNRKRKNG